MSCSRSELALFAAGVLFVGGLGASQGCLGSLDYLSTGAGGGGTGGGTASSTTTSTSTGGGASQGGGGAGGVGGGDACGGADLQTDEDNCGLCGQRCWDGPCDAGVCAVYVVAEGQDDPFGIDVDDTHVYWSNFGSRQIARAPKGGGASEVLATSGTDLQFLPTFLHLTSTNVIATNLDSGSFGHNIPLLTVAKPGGTPEGLAYPGGDGTADFAIAGGSIYMAHGPTGTIREGFFATTMLTNEAFVTGQAFPRGIVHVDWAIGEYLFWTNVGSGAPGGLMGKGLPSGSPAPIEPVTIPTAQGIAANDELLFVTTGGAVFAVDPFAPLVTELAPSQIGAIGVAADASRVYWVTAGASAALQTIDADPDAADTAVVLASPLPSPRQIVLDDEFIYWTNQGDRDQGDVVPQTGVVLRMRKPTSPP